MLFNSLDFVFFFLAVLLFYSLTPTRYRWAPLLAGSYYFYFCFEPLYVTILIAATVLDYYCGLRMGKTRDLKQKRNFLFLSLFFNLGLLFVFKYLDFFNGTLEILLLPFNILYHVSDHYIIVPVGLSYYTFKKISYVIDVYRENMEPEKHLGKFALYVSFFPQVTAGPIDRAADLLPQFNQVHRFDYARVTGGLKLIALGMFKKLVIADRLAVLVNSVYNHPHDYQGMDLIITTLLFSIQIYADFSRS
ncbi:MAG: MBOAT family protein, partial [bacterium]|nr:MBOAT family protein [bacterium]